MATEYAVWFPSDGPVSEALIQLNVTDLAAAKKEADGYRVFSLTPDPYKIFSREAPEWKEVTE